jgi:hypothetical protein
MKRTLILASLLVSSSVFANDIDPLGFEKQVFVGTKSRAEVVADAKVALAAGQIPAGEQGVRFADEPSVKSRVQVAAETREAARQGLLTSYGESGRKSASFEQEQRIQVAGLRAIGHVAAAE